MVGARRGRAHLRGACAGRHDPAPRSRGRGPPARTDPPRGRRDVRRPWSHDLHEAAHRHPCDPQLLPVEHDARLLRERDRIQPAGDRPVGAEPPVRELLRLVRRHAPERLRPEGADDPARSVDRGDRATTCWATRRSATSSAANGGAGKAAFLMFDEETEQLAAELGLDVAFPPRGAPPPAGLEDRDHAARQRGRRAERAEHDGSRHRLPALLQLAATAGLGDDLVVQTPYGDSGQTTFFIANEGDWEADAKKIVGQRHQGDAADRAARGCAIEGVDHASRHAGRAVDGRAHRVPRADALRRRLVRQRGRPRVLHASSQRELARERTRSDGRPAAAGGVPRLLRARLPGRRGQRRAVPRRAEPARDGRQLA